MKKALSLLLAFALTFPMCFGLISCGNTNNPSDDNPTANNPSDDNPEQEPFRVDLAGYVANIGNATALGISKKTKSSASPMASYRTSSSSIKLLSYNTLASNEDTGDRNYIVMSTTNYDANAPEADETGLTKVTFTKIVTENVTTETTGTKFIISNEGKISISAIEGFKYTVYYNDSLVYNEVQDNDSNDKDTKVGVIVLDNLIDGIEYKVNYKGIGVETTITQDEINGEIDKLYVLNGYTFISFVPLGMSQRLDDNNLNYDADGIDAYDKIGYYSSTLRQSFVIDNSTGYVYQIKTVGIDEIKNNLIIISGKIYDMRVTENDELQFFTVVQNETLTIYDYFKDKYGNKYIKNNALDVYDEANQTLYYTDGVYLLSKENVVICIESNGDIFDIDLTEITSIRKIESNFEKKDILSTEAYTFEKSNKATKIVSHIDNGFLYAYSINGRFVKIDVNTYNKQMIALGVKDVTFFDPNLQKWHTHDYDALAINYNTALLYYENDLYFYKLWENEMIYIAPYFDNIRHECILILEDTEDSFNSQNIQDLSFTKTTITGTAYYRVTIDENGLPKVVNSETYVAPEQQIVTLQPINKN